MNQNLHLSTYSEGLDDFQVIVDADSTGTLLKSCFIEDPELAELYRTIEQQENVVTQKIRELEREADRLTSHADAADYSLAAACGVLCGIIDSFFVGAFDYKTALKKVKKSDIDERVNNFVKGKAEELRIKDTIEQQTKGKNLTAEQRNELEKKIREGLKRTFENKEQFDAENKTLNALGRAISKLEEHYKLPLDNVFQGEKGINAVTHHLDDIAHHPTPAGLIAALIGKFLRVAILVDKDGHWHIKFVKQDFKEWLKVIAPLAISAILTWLLYIVKKKKSEEVNKLPKPIQNLIVLLAQTPAAVAVLQAIADWLGHLASDIAGSSSSAYKGKRGMGVPGVFLSLLKEISSIPPLNSTPLPKVINDLYYNDKPDKRNNLDFRTELGMFEDISKYIGKQTIPVIGGEIVVRTFYFVRHLVQELHIKKELNLVDWKSILPFGNRTIARMMTVESAVFTTFDIADASIRSTIKTGGPENPLFWKELIFSVNFVGIGRCVIAVGVEIKMEYDKRKILKERVDFKYQLLTLRGAKMYIHQNNMWRAAQNAEESIKELSNCFSQLDSLLIDLMSQSGHDFEDMPLLIQGIAEHNPDLREKIIKIFLKN